jgi:hypothetical protein
MQYVLLIYTDDTVWDAQTDEWRHKAYEEYMEFSGAPQIRSGRQLQAATTATTVRAQNGDVLTTDGPFTETKEVLGGFFIVECGDLDEAIELAGRCPGARHGTVEVRPLVESTQ